MIEKRFTYEYDDCNCNLFDNNYNTFYHIEDSEENIHILCNRLNKLVYENEQLKQSNKGLQSELQIFKEDIKHSNIIINKLNNENEELKKQISELKEDVSLLLAFYRWYPFAVEKKEHQAYNRLWDFVND